MKGRKFVQHILFVLNMSSRISCQFHCIRYPNFARDETRRDKFREL